MFNDDDEDDHNLEDQDDMEDECSTSEDVGGVGTTSGNIAAPSMPVGAKLKGKRKDGSYAYSLDPKVSEECISRLAESILNSPHRWRR